MRIVSCIGRSDVEGEEMKFNADHKVIISTLSTPEAKAFIKFLKSEIIRHEDDIRQAENLIKIVEATRL